MEEEKKEKGFVIKDKRLFDEAGEVRRDPELTKTKAAKPEKLPDDQTTPDEPEDPDQHQEAYLPEVNFSNLILSLSTTIMYHFGDFPDPVTNKSVRNLQAAKHTIDTIGMLKHKTAGNLDANESNLLDGLLFELRMRYVKETSHK